MISLTGSGAGERGGGADGGGSGGGCGAGEGADGGGGDGGVGDGGDGEWHGMQFGDDCLSASAHQVGQTGTGIATRSHSSGTLCGSAAHNEGGLIYFDSVPTDGTARGKSRRALPATRHDSCLQQEATVAWYEVAVQEMERRRRFVYGEPEPEREPPAPPEGRACTSVVVESERAAVLGVLRWISMCDDHTHRG